MTPAEIAELRALRDAADNATSRGYRVVAENTLGDWLLAHADVLLAAAEENARLRAKVSTQFNATFAKLRETLGVDIGSGGGLVAIITGIDGLREERDRLRGTVDDIASYVQPYDVEDSAVQELPPLADAVRDLVADRDALLAAFINLRTAATTAPKGHGDESEAGRLWWTVDTERAVEQVIEVATRIEKETGHG